MSPTNVRFGSKADISLSPDNVRFASESGHPIGKIRRRSRRPVSNCRHGIKRVVERYMAWQKKADGH
jgi:hypothetical protein